MMLNRQGFAPDCNNEEMIRYHAKAVGALGEHLGKDGLISYIELGSLGHWGEWHVNYSAGIQRLPNEAVRKQYVVPWTGAFPDAMLLMRDHSHMLRNMEWDCIMIWQVIRMKQKSG